VSAFTSLGDAMTWLVDSDAAPAPLIAGAQTATRLDRRDTTTQMVCLSWGLRGLKRPVSSHPRDNGAPIASLTCRVSGMSYPRVSFDGRARACSWRRCDVREHGGPGNLGLRIVRACWTSATTCDDGANRRSLRLRRVVRN